MPSGGVEQVGLADVLLSVDVGGRGADEQLVVHRRHGGSEVVSGVRMRARHRDRTAPAAVEQVDHPGVFLPVDVGKRRTDHQRRPDGRDRVAELIIGTGTASWIASGALLEHADDVPLRAEQVRGAADPRKRGAEENAIVADRRQGEAEASRIMALFSRIGQHERDGGRARFRVGRGETAAGSAGQRRQRTDEASQRGKQQRDTERERPGTPVRTARCAGPRMTSMSAAHASVASAIASLWTLAWHARQPSRRVR